MPITRNVQPRDPNGAGGHRSVRLDPDREDILPRGDWQSGVGFRRRTRLNRQTRIRAAIDELFDEHVIWRTIGGRSATGRKELELFVTEATADTENGAFAYRTTEVMHVADGNVTERWAFSDDTPTRIAQFFSQLG